MSAAYEIQRSGRSVVVIEPGPIGGRLTPRTSGHLGFEPDDRVDAQIINIDKSARRVSLSIKSLEMAEDKEAVEKFGSSDSGASLGDILGAALRERANKE